MKPERILYINGGLMDNGGISAYMMNYYRHMDRSKIQIDFVVHGYEKGVHDDELIACGSKIYHVPVKSKAPFKNRKMLKEIMQTGQYKIVHSHMDAMNYVPLKIAKECGIPVRISHSHNTQYLTNSKLKVKLNEYVKNKIPSVATHLFACSMEAGKWLYGAENIDKIQTIPNAIEISKFLYNSQKRNEIRQELALSENDILIGHVGKFEYQKNHEYLIDVFYKLCQLNKNYKLALIGEGSLKDQIKEKSNKLCIQNNVFFLGAKSDVNDYYNAFDLLCFPSHFEGLGIVLVEAQTNGLKCITSDATPKEVNISGNVEFLSIHSENVESWVKKIIETSKERTCSETLDRIITAGYSIKNEAINLQKLYEELMHYGL